MNVIRALTWRQLLGSRRRFLVTLLGVMLSATMVTAVLVGMDSAFASLYRVLRIHRRRLPLGLLLLG